MRRKNGHRVVASVEQLDVRVVLTVSTAGLLQPPALVHLHAARMAARNVQAGSISTLMAPGVGNVQARPTRITPNQRLVDQINQSFTSFQNDYLPILNVYLNNSSFTTEQAKEMKTYLQQRTKLLSQELTRTLVHVPGFATKQQNGGVPLMTFLDRKILGAIDQTKGTAEQSLSLFNSLEGLLPATKPAEGTATIYSTGAINAIQAANTATLNAMGYAAYNVFGKPAHA